MEEETQHTRILKVLRRVRDESAGPVGFILIKDGVVWLSSRYIKQVMLLGECNGRISELRAEGFDIATLDGERDEHGFAYHRLVSEPGKAAKASPPPAPAPERKKKIVGHKTVWIDGVAYARPIIEKV